MTRYLSAAVTFDDSLAAQLIENVLEEPHRAIAATPGVSLATVLRYALAANRRRLIRDVLLLIYLALMICTFFLAFITVPLFLFVSWMTILSELYIRFYGQPSQPLRPGKFGSAQPPSPARNSYAARQLARIEEASTSGNATFYSGFSPFIGYGTITSSWSFVVNVTSPRRSSRAGRPRPFTVTQLYDHVASGLDQIDLPGMEFHIRLFVNGRDIRDDDRFLRDPDGPPVSSVHPGLLDSLMTNPEERARPYLTISVAGWHGDLVTTTFIRFLLSESDLFVEAARTAVPPLRYAFKTVDTMEMAPADGEFPALLKSSFLRTLPLLLHSGPAVIHEMRRGSRRLQKKRQLNRMPDYGALVSVREAAADSKWQRYFQVFDNARYVKTVEQRVFHSLVEFLDAHDVQHIQPGHPGRSDHQQRHRDLRQRDRPRGSDRRRPRGTGDAMEFPAPRQLREQRAGLMTSSSENNGVQIGGSARVTAGAIAGGPGARATSGNTRLTVTDTDLQELRGLLLSIAGQVRESSASLQGPDEAAALVADAQQEAAKPDPDMGRLSRTLHALLAAAGDVTALATAVSAVQHMVSAFL